MNEASLTTGRQRRALHFLVDGRFKQQFEHLSQSQEAGNALLKKFPNLKVEVYDAVKRVRISL